METHFHVFTQKYQYFEKSFEGTLLKVKHVFHDFILSEAFAIIVAQVLFGT